MIKGIPDIHVLTAGVHEISDYKINSRKHNLTD